MKVSQIDIDFVAQYLNLDIDKEDLMQIIEIKSYISASKSFIKEYTKLSDEEIDKREYLVIPVLQLIADMNDNKSVEGYRFDNKTYLSFLKLARRLDL